MSSGPSLQLGLGSAWMRLVQGQGSIFGTGIWAPDNRSRIYKASPGDLHRRLFLARM